MSIHFINPKFQLGDYVTKINGSSWRGMIVGMYHTALTPEGYCVESAFEPGSVQIYPAHALAFWDRASDIALAAAALKPRQI